MNVCACGEALPGAVNYRKCPGCGSPNPLYRRPRWPFLAVGGLLAVAMMVSAGLGLDPAYRQVLFGVVLIGGLLAADWLADRV